MNEVRTADQTARFAMNDYLSLGPRPDYGEVEVEALGEWLADCQNVPLSPKERLIVGGMHVDRAWSIALNAGIGNTSPEQTTMLDEDLQNAEQHYKLATLESYPQQIGPFSEAIVAKQGVEVLASLLRGNGVSEKKRGRYLLGQTEAVVKIFDDYKRHGRLGDMPILHAAAGALVLTSAYHFTDYLVLPSGIRHYAGKGSHYDYWHAQLYNLDNDKRYRVRIAPNGPPDYLVVSPELLHNADYAQQHGLGTLAAFAQVRDCGLTGRVKNRQDEIASEHCLRVEEVVGIAIGQQMYNFLEKKPTIPDDEVVQWYRALSPYVDPNHASHGGLFEKAISHLEYRYALDALEQDEKILLAQMHLESALSFEAQHSGNMNALIGSFDRAEDILLEAINSLEAGSIIRYQLSMDQATSALYRAMVTEELVEESTDYFTDAMIGLAQEMLEDYGGLADKSSDRARALNRLLQEVTVCLLPMASQAKSHLVLPALPRHRQGGATKERGWDFTIWIQGQYAYEQGGFTLRMADKEDIASLDKGVLTIAEESLQQLNPKYDFNVLRATLVALGDPSKKVDGAAGKRFTKVQRNFLRILDEASR